MACISQHLPRRACGRTQTARWMEAEGELQKLEQLRTILTGMQLVRPAYRLKNEDSFFRPRADRNRYGQHEHGRNEERRHGTESFVMRDPLPCSARCDPAHPVAGIAWSWTPRSPTRRRHPGTGAARSGGTTMARWTGRPPPPVPQQAGRRIRMQRGSAATRA